MSLPTDSTEPTGTDCEDSPMPRYAVYYASAGCLPDAEPAIFETLKDAREYIAEQWADAADDANETARDAEDVLPWQPLAYLQAVDATRDMEPGSGADDPRPGSLYRWTIEELSDDSTESGTLEEMPDSPYVRAVEEYPIVILDADGEVIDRAANVESTISVLYGDLQYHDGRARTVLAPTEHVDILKQYAAENADCWQIPLDIVKENA